MNNTYATGRPGRPKSAGPWPAWFDRGSSLLKAGLLLMLFFVAGTKANAQVSAYTFVQSVCSYTPITGGSV
ncbi:MAG: hypothetical protein ACK54P_17865, partial [Bacteroidota bacterium]